MTHLYMIHLHWHIINVSKSLVLQNTANGNSVESYITYTARNVLFDIWGHEELPYTSTLHEQNEFIILVGSRRLGLM